MQVARTAAIFNVDELIIIDDSPEARSGTVSAGAAFMARVAQYLETPQYLRKALIPMHPDLRLAGLLPPLDAPHHMRATEWKPYREGLVLKAQPGVGSYVDIGLDRMAFVSQQVPVNTRVTLHVGDSPVVQFMQDFGENMIMGKVGVWLPDCLPIGSQVMCLLAIKLFAVAVCDATYDCGCIA